MSRNRLNVASGRFRGRSQIQEIRRSLWMALQRLAPMNPSRWMVTAVQGSHHVFPSISPGKPLDAQLSLQIGHHCAVCVASSSSTLTLELAAKRHGAVYSRTLPVTVGILRFWIGHADKTMTDKCWR